MFIIKSLINKVLGLGGYKGITLSVCLSMFFESATSPKRMKEDNPRQTNIKGDNYFYWTGVSVVIRLISREIMISTGRVYPL